MTSNLKNGSHNNNNKKNDDDSEDEFFGFHDSDKNNNNHDEVEEEHEEDHTNDLFASSPSSSFNHNNANNDDTMIDRQRRSKEQELRMAGYHQAFDEYQDTSLQEGFERGVYETFDIAIRIGKLLGYATTQQMLVMKSTSDQVDSSKVDEATTVIRDFFSKQFQKEETLLSTNDSNKNNSNNKNNNCTVQLERLEQTLQAILKKEELSSMALTLTTTNKNSGNSDNSITPGLKNMGFYSKFDTLHGKDGRKTWYNDATQAYMDARPRYPSHMIRRALQEAKLYPPAHILEVGCGLGTATLPLAQLGFTITAMDPAPRNCVAARAQCQEFRHRVTIVESTLEDYQHPDGLSPISAILCPTSFHWISPDVACEKTAQLLLQSNPTGRTGCLLLWWAMPPQPTLEICDRLQDVYDAMEESNLGRDMRQYCDQHQIIAPLDAMRIRLNESGQYHSNDDPLQMEGITFRYTPERYVTLLSTLSPYLALEETKRKVLLERLLQRLHTICDEQGTTELLMTGFFGTQCFWVKNQTKTESSDPSNRSIESIDPNDDDSK
ncbi:methylase [Nitzschia inconspicua]|uniref:Methylase n=1 Tax=Nitzschia inconspicua TaxID=303405 RepID=A0A9K3KMM8_9STRA|nr:methylase [Nitzschia inconspicua]